MLRFLKSLEKEPLPFSSIKILFCKVTVQFFNPIGQLTRLLPILVVISNEKIPLPQTIFPIGHDVAAHEEIGGSVHDDAGTEVFAAHI